MINTFTDDEVRSLLDSFSMSSYLSARNKLILAIAFDTGSRNTETCSIQEEDIRGNVILIHGKGNKERHVPLTPYLRKFLIKYLRIKQLYFEDKVIPYRNLLLSRLLGHENINITKRYKNNSYDIVLVQRLLQHSSAATTQRYIGIEPQRIEQAIENHSVLM